MVGSVFLVSLYLRATHTSRKMSAYLCYSEMEDINELEVRSKVWKVEEDCELRLLPDCDSEGDPVQCICMVGSGEPLSMATAASSDLPEAPKPLCQVGPGYSVESAVSSSSQSTSPTPIQPEWVPLDEGSSERNTDDFYEDYYRRAREAENEREARKELYSRRILDSWVELASWSIGTSEEDRQAFLLRPQWPVVEHVINAALASYYRGPGNPPKIFG